MDDLMVMYSKDGINNKPSPEIRKVFQMKTTVITDDNTLPATATKSVEKDSQNKIAAELTNRWTASIGKSVENVLELANILHDAYFKLEADSYKEWLENVAKMGESSASKYRDIAQCKFFQDEKNHHLLPFEWTKMYELTRISNHAKFKNTPDGGASAIKDVLKFITTKQVQNENTENPVPSFPTVVQITAKVDGILDKKRKPLQRVGKLVTNNVKSAAAADREINAANIKAELAERTAADLERKLAVAEAAAKVAVFHAPDPVTGVKNLPKASAPLGMSSGPKEDHNKIVFKNFDASYKKTQRTRLEQNLLALLHDEKLMNVEITVFQVVGAKVLAA